MILWEKDKKSGLVENEKNLSSSSAGVALRAVAKEIWKSTASSPAETDITGLEAIPESVSTYKNIRLETFNYFVKRATVIKHTWTGSKQMHDAVRHNKSQAYFCLDEYDFAVVDFYFSGRACSLCRFALFWWDNECPTRSLDLEGGE